MDSEDKETLEAYKEESKKEPQERTPPPPLTGKKNYDLIRESDFEGWKKEAKPQKSPKPKNK